MKIANPWRRNDVSITALAFAVLAWVPLAQAADGDWQAKREKTVAAAKKEGRLTIYHSSVYDRLWTEFEKKYPEIELTKVMLPGGRRYPNGSWRRNEPERTSWIFLLAAPGRS